MAFLACCVSQAVSWLLQPVTDALQGSLRTAADDSFSFLRAWITGEVSSRVLPGERAAVEVPVSSTSIVGAEETLEALRKHLSDDSVRVIGIHGMGGVGKTTLLKEINDDFLKPGARCPFDLVIWVTVSKELNILKIQEQIGSRLGLSFSKTESDDLSSLVQEQQRRLLLDALSKKQFLLLLDDVWTKVDPVEIGVPEPSSRKNCKIVFTTRFLPVCSNMGANEVVGVKHLNEAQSQELFCSKLRRDVVLNASIQDLVKQVVEKCGGLPLALITVGRAMANRTLPSEWKNAMKALDDSAKLLPEIEKVLSCLKLSYDYLENDKLRSGLMYCAMYPEDTEIGRAELVEYWVGEGLLDGDGDDEIDDARNTGHVLISKLQDACMLEAGIVDAEQHVRVHDAVRDMALWLQNQDADKVDGFLVLPGENLTHVRRIWMRNMALKASPSCVPNCPNVWTLLLNRTLLRPPVLRGFLNLMRNLRVLDLSMAQVEELPSEIGYIVELGYLNLSWTRIRLLPKELGKLKKLRQLELQWTFKLTWIPREAIVGLSSLQVLNMWRSGYSWGTRGEPTEEKRQLSSSIADAAGEDGRQLELSDLEELDQLQELHIGLGSSHALERITQLPSDVPYRSMECLHLT